MRPPGPVRLRNKFFIPEGERHIAHVWTERGNRRLQPACPSHAHWREVYRTHGRSVNCYLSLIEFESRSDTDEGTYLGGATVRRG